MRILLTGASGFIGAHLSRALLVRGHEVVGCSRQGPIHCDFRRDRHPQDWLPRLEGIDVVINSVGILRERGKQGFAALHHQAPDALFAACEQASIARVIQISALGADANASTAYHLSKHRADSALMARRLNWLILRPSLVYGPGSRSSELLRALAALPRVPLVDNGQQPLQPIHIDDLVRAVIHAVEQPTPSRQVIDCVGARPVTLAQLLAHWRRWLGMGELKCLPVPYPLALAGARLAGLLGKGPLDHDSVVMLQRGNAADVGPFAQAFGFMPRAFAGSLASHPATEAERWHARLYLLRPLLRISLALLWLWTGLTSAFFYPLEASHALLARLGIDGMLAPLALYGAALLDALLGLALLLAWRVREAALLQIALMLGYTLLITLALPEFWLHPFGPVSKNLPLLVATMILIALEAPRR